MLTVSPLETYFSCSWETRKESFVPAASSAIITAVPSGVRSPVTILIFVTMPLTGAFTSPPAAFQLFQFADRKFLLLFCDFIDFCSAVTPFWGVRIFHLAAAALLPCCSAATAAS